MIRTTLLLGACIVLGACAPITRVVLLPQEHHASAVEVSTATMQRTLSAPYAEAEVGRGGRIEIRQADPEATQSRYQALFSATPPTATRLVLRFIHEDVELAPDSQAALGAALGDAKGRPGAEFIVIAHAAGGVAAEESLAARRVQAIRAIILGSGFDPGRIDVHSSSTPGESEKLPEPQVELIVR